MPKKRESKNISEKKSRAKYNCPPKLAELIETVNLVPPDVILPDWTKVFDKYRENNLPTDSKQQKDEKFLKACENTFDECFKDFSEETKQLWLDSSFSYHCSRFPERDPKELIAPALYYVIVVWYRDMRKNREDLRSLADYFTHWRKEGFFTVGDKGLYRGNEQHFRLPELTVSIQITDTIIEVVPTGLGEAIHGVDGDRIRTCEICNRIFWAKRKDSETCSVSCFNILRQRRHRKRNKEEINAKRRENYHYKKSIKNKKEKKDNGTL
jgi:hypothetical protein